jgi:hypothetical protein
MESLRPDEIRHVKAFLLEHTKGKKKSEALETGLFFLSVITMLPFLFGRFGFLAYAVLVMITYFLLMAGVSLFRRKQPIEAAPTETLKDDALKELATYQERGTIVSRFEPEVGRALDRCCDHYFKIKSLLSELPAEKVWTEVKESAEKASLEAIREAFLIALAGVRRQGARRDAFEKRFSEPGSAQNILDPLNDIDHRLNTLCTELSQASGKQVEPTSSMDLALERLREIRVAQDELDHELHQHRQH